MPPQPLSYSKLCIASSLRQLIDKNLEEREYLTCPSQLYPALWCEDGGDQPLDPAELLVLEDVRQQELPTWLLCYSWLVYPEGRNEKPII